MCKNFDRFVVIGWKSIVLKLLTTWYLTQTLFLLVSKFLRDVRWLLYGSLLYLLLDATRQWLLMVCCAVQRFLREGRLPHLLFYGPPGTGKTSTILAVAKQIYSPKEFNSMVLEVSNSVPVWCRQLSVRNWKYVSTCLWKCLQLNASDDRGIDIVRGQILSFASTRTIFGLVFNVLLCCTDFNLCVHKGGFAKLFVTCMLQIPLQACYLGWSWRNDKGCSKCSEKK